MSVQRVATQPFFHAIACILFACSETTTDPGPANHTGGVTGLGGSIASGGQTGGASAQGGGSSQTGGTTAQGGATTTGGAPNASAGASSGGQNNNSGGIAGASGNASSGGASGMQGSGGTASGGQPSSGGVSGSTTAGGSKASGGGGAGVGGGGRGGASATGGSPATGGTTTGGSTAKGGSTSTGGGTATSACIGWAAVNADGVARTTGGEGGPVVQITTAEQLASYRRDLNPMILRIMNDLTGEFELGSNKTVEGATNNITIHGSLSFSGTTTMTLSNLIVRNLKIDAVTSGEDGMDIRYAHHVCVEHCEFVNGPDGNLDVVAEANYVTIAYNKFYYTSAWHPLPDEPSANHRFSNLVGSSNTTELDRGKLKVTFHHNWWADGVIERMPRVRFGDVHVFNNYYSSAGNDYCIAGGKEARLVVENNYFENVANPHEFYDGDTTAQIKASGNEYVNVTGLKDSGQGASFTPPYPYTLDAGASVKAIVMANVGPR